MNNHKKINFYLRAAKIYSKWQLYKLFPAISKNIKINPFLLIIEPTNGCNLCCTYCPETKEKSRKYIEKEEMMRILDIAKKDGVCVISFSGGEPMLHPDFISVCKYAYKKGFVVNLNTNGTLINDKNAHLIANNTDYIRLSLDGNEAIHDERCGIKGTYNKVIKSIMAFNKVKNRKCKIGINVVVTKNSFNYLPDFIKGIETIVDFISFLPEINSVQKSNGNQINNSLYLKDYKRLISTIGKKSGNTREFMKGHNFSKIKDICLAGKLIYSVAWDGNVYSCPFFLEKRPLFRYKDKEFLFSELQSDSPTNYCYGCQATCTYEVSRVFNMNPLKLIYNLSVLKSTFKI